jgi:hypothetical protein
MRACRAVFQLFIDAGTELATRFVDDRRVALVSFTGSTAVGRQVGERLAARLGKSLLELGGNNAVIVDETANLDLAVPAIVFGAAGTAGQRCTSTRRVLVHTSRAAELEKRLVHAYGQIRIGDPLEPGTLMGPLIDARALEQYRSAVAAARAAGAELLYGGKVLAGPGNFVEPTLFRARNDWPIVQTETFAPILYVIPCNRSMRPSLCKTLPRMGSPRRSSPIDCSMRSAICPPPAAIAALPTSISARPGLKSAAPLAARRTPAADASPAPMRGRHTCDARRTRSIGAASCRLRRASSSRCHRQCRF